MKVASKISLTVIVSHRSAVHPEIALWPHLVIVRLSEGDIVSLVGSLDLCSVESRNCGWKTIYGYPCVTSWPINDLQKAFLQSTNRTTVARLRTVPVIIVAETLCCMIVDSAINNCVSPAMCFSPISMQVWYVGPDTRRGSNPAMTRGQYRQKIRGVFKTLDM